jgi:IclR family acetate operon transcriptional repressor
VTRPLGSVERAVALLDALAAAGGPLGTNELARRTQINASTVSRVLATLREAGLVEREPGGQRWQLGLRLVHLGNAALARLDLRDLARPLLEQLVRETGETATLSLPAQGEGVTVDFVPSPHSVSSRAEIGRASVAHATAVGKLVLAHTPGALASLAEPLERYTPRTLTTLAELELAVADVRGAGVAEAAGEREPGLNAIAAPVLADDGRLVAVVGLQGPERFGAEARRAAAKPLSRAAALLAATAGLRRQDQG